MKTIVLLSLTYLKVKTILLLSFTGNAYSDTAITLSKCGTGEIFVTRMIQIGEMLWQAFWSKIWWILTPSKFNLETNKNG